MVNQQLDRPSKKPTNKLFLVIVGIIFIAVVGVSLFLLVRHSSDESPIIKDMEDFKENFKNCEPANVVMAPFYSVSIYHEILGPEEGLCKMKIKYDKHPDPNFEGKEMICKMDFSLDFDSAYQFDDCEGELWDLQKYNPHEEVCENIPCENCKGEHLRYKIGKCVECSFSSDCKNELGCLYGKCVDVECKEEYDDCQVDQACVEGICMNEEEIYNEFQKCNPGDDPYTTCKQICENCENGNYICAIGAYKKIIDPNNPEKTISRGLSFCVECLYDASCKEGHVCRRYKCVKE